MSDSESDRDARGSTLNVKAKLFLQALMSRRFVSESDAKQMHKRCCQIVSSPAGDFAEFIEQISKAIEPFGFAIKKRNAEADGKLWYAIVDTKQDQLTQGATDLKQDELAFFRSVVDAIMEAPDMAYCIRAGPAYALAKEHKINKADGQRLLAQLVLRGWLLRDADTGVYTMSTRCLMELENYLVTNFEEELEGAECAQCKELVFDGLQCPGAECSVRYHTRCRKARARVRPECENCQTEWPAHKGIKIGVASLNVDARGEESDDEPSARKKGGGKKAPAANGKKQGKRKSRAAQTSDVEEEEEEEDELDEEFRTAASQLNQTLDGSMNGTSGA